MSIFDEYITPQDIDDMLTGKQGTQASGKLIDEDLQQLLAATSANEVGGQGKLSKMREGFNAAKGLKGREVLSKKEVDRLLRWVSQEEVAKDEKVPTMAQSMGIKFDQKPTYRKVLAKVKSILGNKPEPTKNTQSDREM